MIKRDKNRYIQVAMAFKTIVESNNPMVGFINLGVTVDELEQAKVMFTIWSEGENSDINSDEEIKVFKEAITLIEQEIKGLKI